MTEIFNINDFDKLNSIAQKLGSDVPFFVNQYPVALCEGRGEIVKKIDFRAELPYIIIIFPEISISTKLVYETMRYDYKVDEEKFNYFLNSLRKEGKIDFSFCLLNRLEESTFRISKEVKKIKDFLNENDIVALMSGSGSSVFGLSYDYEKIESIKNILLKKYEYIYITKIV